MNDARIRRAIQAHFAAIGRDEVEAAEIYADDAVLEYVQSRERIRGRANIIASRQAYPGRSSTFTIERLHGSRNAWTAEITLRFDGADPHPFVAVLELRDGRVIREAIYIAEPWDPPAYRAPFAEVVPLAKPWDATPSGDDS
ncbi:nuclear transport factor 2 family protein [soil metagenome]